MAGQPGFFDVDERLRRLSDLGDQLEAYGRVVDFELFRPELEAALSYSDGAKGGRPPYDAVLMFKVLVIQAQNNLSDERTEFLINDRLSFMRFLGLALGDRVPDATTIWLFREKLTKAGAIEALFARFDAAVRAAGYIPMSGQIIDASLVAAPRQRTTEAEKIDIKAGRIPQEWQDKPAKLRQKDQDARWTVKVSKAKPKADGTRQLDIAVPVFGYQSHIVFGYQSHISIDRRHGLIRRWAVTDAAASAGRLLRCGLLDKTNTASDVWADTAYRSRANETYMAENGFTSRIHRKKPTGRPMPECTRQANARKSAVRSRIEHVFAEQKSRMGLFIRTIGIARARVKIGLANLAFNMKRLIWLERAAPV
jgi:IS5 family transposase